MRAVAGRRQHQGGIAITLGLSWGCIVPIGVVVATVVAVVAWKVWEIHTEWSPDPGPVARSTAVAQADQRATTKLDTRLHGLVTTIQPTGPTPLVSIVDRCVTSNGSLLTHADVRCDRTATAYLEVDGDPTAFAACADSALRSAGWQPAAPDHIRYYDRRKTAVDIAWNAPPATLPPARVAYRERVPVDVTALMKRYPHLLTVTTTLEYFVSWAGTSNPTLTAPNNYPCVAGGCTCVGG